MTKDIFKPADILLPKNVDFSKWSVIACDQFTSDPDYWKRVYETVGDRPSTLNMIIPEARLNEVDEETAIEKIRRSMKEYLKQDLFSELKDSFIYAERTLPGGHIRRGLIGTVDLDEYDFSGADASILASEGTVVERLPARIRIRRAAPLESPHIIAFINDKEKTVIEQLGEKTDKLQQLYDFDLMEGGGHIRGKRVYGSDADMVIAAMRELYKKSDALMVIGDGNHSLAAAKVYWDELKKDLSADERTDHPAGRALLEINNVFDPAINFEAIHRVLFDIDTAGLISALKDRIPAGSDYELRCVTKGQDGVIGVSAGCIGEMLSAVQSFLDEYVDKTGCRIDYIHEAGNVICLAEADRNLGILMPTMDKSELFDTVLNSGVFPKKSFSVGHARDKRYYLECRAIRKGRL